MERMEELKNLTEISNSMFYMWRAVFSMAHADHVVTPEERKFMNTVLEKLPFSEEQVKTLESDISTPRWIGEMFAKIENDDDKSLFFYYARLMVWSDGDFDAQERHIISELQKKHVEGIDWDNAKNVIGLEFEGEEKEVAEKKAQIIKDYSYVEDMEPEGTLKAFFRRFFGG